MSEEFPKKIAGYYCLSCHSLVNYRHSSSVGPVYGCDCLWVSAGVYEYDVNRIPNRFPASWQRVIVTIDQAEE